MQLAEFEASFAAYVRPDADGGLNDYRDRAAREMAVVPVDMIGEFMEVADLAAVFSCCVGVRAPASDLVELEGDDLFDTLRTLRHNDALPLQATAGHPAEKMLVDLIDSPEGCLLYLQLAMILEWASTQPGMRVHMYDPNKEED